MFGRKKGNYVWFVRGKRRETIKEICIFLLFGLQRMGNRKKKFMYFTFIP